MIIWPRATLKLELTATTYYSIVFCIKHNICPHVQSLATLTTALFENNKFDIFFSSSQIEHKRACAIWSNSIHTLWACADAIWGRNSNHLMSWDTKEVLGRLIMVSTDPNSFTAFFFFLYRQLLPPFYDIRIFTYFRSMSCYRIINLAKLPLTKCHKIIMWKYNRNKVRLLREFFL